jgi:uncharacterized protein YlxW (UPF0749 family)
MSVDERAREDILALSDTILETREAVTRIERRQNQHGRILTTLQEGQADLRAQVSDLQKGQADLRAQVGEILSLLRER